eukprot:Pgem_evm1s9789
MERINNEKEQKEEKNKNENEDISLLAHFIRKTLGYFRCDDKITLTNKNGKVIEVMYCSRK